MRPKPKGRFKASRKGEAGSLSKVFVHWQLTVGPEVAKKQPCALRALYESQMRTYNAQDGVFPTQQADFHRDILLDRLQLVCLLCRASE